MVGVFVFTSQSPTLQQQQQQQQIHILQISDAMVADQLKETPCEIEDYKFNVRLTTFDAQKHETLLTTMF